MSNDKRQVWRTVSDEVMTTYADSPMGTTHAVEMAAEKGYDLGKYHGRQEATPAHVVDKNGHALTTDIEAARAEGFAAGLQRARDLLDTDAAAAESYARGQAAEAEQVQARATASATRAAVQRNGVDLLNREIAALKGEGK